MRARTRAILALAAVSLALGGAAAAPASAQGDEELPARLLVVALPSVTFDDIADHDLPALEAFLATAALADLAPRGVSPRSGPGDAYLTISAGARTTTEGSVDGQVLALDEQSSGSAAGEIFRRRTGVVPDGEYVALGWPALVRDNAREPYDAVLGLLQETLAAHGVSTSVVANADGTDSIGASYERQAGLAFADHDGVVADGSLGKELLLDDPAQPFGVRFESDLVMERFAEAWSAAAPVGDDDPGGVVLVEASDLARVLRYRSAVDASRYRTLRDEALAGADELFGRLMAQVDPERDAVLVLAPYNRGGDRDLVLAALRRPGTDPGYLASASTQRAGFLTLVDIAPTILDTFDIDRPVDMEGRPAEVSASDASLGDRVDHLVALNAASRFRENLLSPTTYAVVFLLTAITAATTIAIASGRGARWRRHLATLALFDLALFPMSYLARAFPLEDLGIGFYWAFTAGLAAAVAAAATWVGRRTRRPRLGLVLVLALVAVVLAADVMTGSNLSLSAAFGYSPTGNSRLYGISNYSYGQVAGATCLLAAFLAASRPAGPGRAAAIGLLVATLIVLGVPVWGSDVGGVLAFTPTIGLFAVMVWGLRVRIRTVVAAGLATLAAIVAFGFLDLARPAEQRAHLGRLFERVGEEGLGPVFDLMERKLLANLRVSTSSFWVVAIPVAVGFWLFLSRHPRQPLTIVRERLPTLGAGLTAALLAAGVGSLVNDSGAIVGGVCAAVVAASLVHLVNEPEPA